MNLQAARDNEENFPGDFDDFAENIQEEIEDEFDMEEIDIQQVSNYSVVELVLQRRLTWQNDGVAGEDLGK